MLSTDLHLLSDAERRGAELALAHVRQLAERMRRTAQGKAPVSIRPADRSLLLTGAQAIANAADIVRRDLSPPLKPWHVGP